jgi:hypothetical protein
VSDQVYRRRIELRPSNLVVDAAMEDYLHHVGLRLHHDGVTITAVEVAPERLPWTTCPVGVAGAAALEGVAIGDVSELDRWMGGRASQCVHVVDLAVLAAAATRRGTARTYEVWVEPVGDGVRAARLLVDGAEWATWRMRGYDLVAEGRFAGLALDRRTFSSWVGAHLEADEAEMAFVLRRGLSIGISRTMDMDGFTHPVESMGAPESCHTFRADVSSVGLRNIGSARRTEDDGEGAPVPAAPLRPVHRRGVEAGPDTA